MGALDFDNVLLLADFNIYTDVAEPFRSCCFNFTESFDFRQHVSDPTNNHGHTLELVFTLGLSLTSVGVEEYAISDHKHGIFQSGLSVRSESPKLLNVQFQFQLVFFFFLMMCQ